MSNEYFNHTAQLSKNTLARAQAVNTTFTSVASGFDLLPSNSQFIQNNITYGVDSGSVNAYEVTMPKPFFILVVGFRVAFKALITNTGASTLNIYNASAALIGAVTIKATDGNNVIAGDIVGGNIVDFVYDGTNFQLMSPRGSLVAATAASAVDAAASAAAALVSENNASGSAISSAADVVTTNADVVLTNADAATTAQDAIDTAADVVTTNNNVITTTADVASTNADVVLTAADVVSTASDAADTAADAISTAADAASAVAAAGTAASDASSASGSAIAAAASFDSFDDIWLGSKAVEPTLDNDGDPLTTGSMYFNTVNNTPYIWNGTAWEQVTAGGPFSIKSANYTASADDKLGLDSTGGAFTITLPPSPSSSDQINLVDAGGALSTYNVTVARNGKTIEGLSENMTISSNSINLYLQYNGTTWVVFGQISSGIAALVADTSPALGGNLAGGSFDVEFGGATKLNLPSSAGAAGTLWSNSGIVTVAQEKQ